MQERNNFIKPSEDALEFRDELNQKIQLAASTGNIRRMYDGIKKSIAPVQRMTYFIKLSTGVILTEKNKQMGRLVEHYSNIYSRQKTVSQKALDLYSALKSCVSQASRNSTVTLITQPMAKHQDLTAYNLI